MNSLETWRNKNLAAVVNGNYNYTVWLLVYEPAKENIKEVLEKFEVDNGYDKYSLSSAKNKTSNLRTNLNGSNPILYIYPQANNYVSFNEIVKSPYVVSYPVGSSSFSENLFQYSCSVSWPWQPRPASLDNYVKPLDIIKIEKINKN